MLALHPCRSFCGAFYSHLQSCSILHSLIFEQNSLEKTFANDIRACLITNVNDRAVSS